MNNLKFDGNMQNIWDGGWQRPVVDCTELERDREIDRETDRYTYIYLKWERGEIIVPVYVKIQLNY